MPTYEYECQACGYRFEARQGMTEAVLKECPKCQGTVQRLISGGTGFILKGKEVGQPGRQGQTCSWEQSGVTCCGREERCGRPSCGDD
ncbi:MAG: FmdB family zinc ribbon protein [Thermodesulfobacteriota bacterium]